MITLSDYRAEDQRSTAFDSLLGWIGTEVAGARTIWPFSRLGLPIPGGRGLLERWAGSITRREQVAGATRLAGLFEAQATVFSPTQVATTPLPGKAAQARRIADRLGRRAATSFTRHGIGAAPIAAGIKDLGSAVRLFRFGFGVSFGLTLARGALDWASSISTVSAEPFRGAPGGEPMYFGGAAYTQRQRALAAIHNSQLTTRAIFGNEASYVH